MANSRILPSASAQISDSRGLATPQFYRFFQALAALDVNSASQADIEALQTEIAAIQAEINALPAAQYPVLQVQAPIISYGLLQNGFAKLGMTTANSVVVNGNALQLDGDALAPGNTYYYGTGPTGTKGWNTVASTMAVASTARMTQTVGTNGVSTFDLATVADSGAGTLLAITRDAYGRVSGTKAATITGTAGRVTVANGDAAAGVPTIDLAEIADAGGGSLLKFARDAWGRVTGTSTPTTTDLAEGSNLYYTTARVLATVLAGLSTATNAAITAADSVLVALGKLQAQISANVTALAGKLAASANLSDVANAATARGNLGVVIPQGYIDGLQMVWNSATSISVTSGTAYIPSLANVLASNSTLTLSGLSLAASTWYHVYLYSNAGTPAIECVTTAPVLYNGTAYQKTGDSTRRYLGSVRTQVSGGGIMRFDQSEPQHVMYMESINNDGLNVITNGASTSTAVIACSAVVPVTSRRCQMYAENTSTTGIPFIACPPLVPFTDLITFIRLSGRITQVFLLDSAQEMNYSFNIAPNAGTGLTMWVLGYYYER